MGLVDFLILNHNGLRVPSLKNAKTIRERIEIVSIKGTLFLVGK